MTGLRKDMCIKYWSKKVVNVTKATVNGEVQVEMVLHRLQTKLFNGFTLRLA